MITKNFLNSRECNNSIICTIFQNQSYDCDSFMAPKMQSMRPTSDSDMRFIYLKV